MEAEEKKDDDHMFKLWPWDRDEKPYFINEEGFEWYMDKHMLAYARQDTLAHKGLKNIYPFIVKKGENISRVLIDDKQNQLYDTLGFEAMAVRIDMIKANHTYDEADKNKK